jgi:predicted Zn-dependent peptidase
VTTADFLTFHRKYIVPANATIIVVGDVTPVTILPRLERAFGSWKGSGAIPPPAPPIVPTAGRTLILIDKPGAEQSVIRIGRVAAPRLTDDYDAMTVMNTILGGSFTSRLNQNLRERHGYTYGASSGFDFRPLAGPFIASSSVQTAVTDKALSEFLKEFQRMLVMVPDSDLSRAKNYMAFRFPGGFETVSQIANRLEELVIYGLPDDYFDGAIDRILAVTKGDVLRAAEKYIRMENLAFVIVGDLATIADSVKSLDIAPATVLTVDDALGPLQHGASGE